jgi:hypothetical protein
LDGNLGFLTVVREGNAYVGGYLVTNQWGRPLEFRLSTPVQPNRVQQILYAETLEPYICGDLIGKTLIDKTSTAIALVVTDTAAALALRNRLDLPVVYLEAGPDQIRCHTQYPGDGPLANQMLEKVRNSIDLAEPFRRVREALNEARKMGVTNRA